MNIMMNRQERQALAAKHKEALLEQLNHRKEVALSKGDQTLLQQLEAEAAYLNAKPIPLNLKAFLPPAKSQASHQPRSSWRDWFSKRWATRVMTEPKSN
jgi:hypothetical protein